MSARKKPLVSPSPPAPGRDEVTRVGEAIVHTSRCRQPRASRCRKTRGAGAADKAQQKWPRAREGRAQRSATAFRARGDLLQRAE
eukprot:1846279-Prymnesium_polylepis.1